MSKIFLSYRRTDTADVAGRIYDRLVQQFGREAVFKDVYSIPLGINFRKHLDEKVAKCDVFLAVIGPDWKGAQDGTDQSRLEDSRDFVRIEVESALKRQIPVIPVLVRGATFPNPEQLPGSMQELSERHGIVVRPDPDFHRDMDRLISHLTEQAALAEAPPTKSEEKLLSELRMLMLSSRTVRELQEGLYVLENHLIKNPSSVEAKLLQHDMQAAIEKAAETVAAKCAAPPHIPVPIKRHTTLQPGFIAVLSLILMAGAVYIDQQLRSGGSTSPPMDSSPPISAPQHSVPPITSRPPSMRIPEMIRISPGSFMMGASNDEAAPIHNVQFTKPFAIARYETTFDEYDLFARATGRQLPNDNGWGRGQRPVVNVSWDNAKAYAEWLSQQTGKRYRLPTEAEWEYAARSGGRDESWAGTSDESQLKEYAVYSVHDHVRGTERVGSKKPNGLGLYDMSGNVWEWVEDCNHSNYYGAPTDGSAWLGTNNGHCGERVFRGGSWYNEPGEVHASIRSWSNADKQNHSIGFRLAQDLS